MNFEEGNECENGDQQEKKGRWQQNHTGIAEVELEELRRKIKRNIKKELWNYIRRRASGGTEQYGKC